MSDSNLTRQPNLAELLIGDNMVEHVGENDLLQLARAVTDGAAWVVGQCASIWCERFARGRTDADFAALVGLSRQVVNNRRRVFERFCSTYSNFPSLTWSHFAVAITWHDADTCLEWAQHNSITAADCVSVAEMCSYRANVLGHDDSPSTEPAVEDEPELPAAAGGTRVDQLEHDPAEATAAETIEAAGNVDRWPASEANTPHEQLGEQSAEFRLKAIRSGCHSIARAFQRLAEINDTRIESILTEHVAQLLDSFAIGRPAVEINGIDDATFEALTRPTAGKTK